MEPIEAQATDMAADTQVAPAGAAPEPVAPAQPQATSPETADPNADLWKRLESVDPKTLPENVRSRFDMRQADYTRKTQELARERQAMVERENRLLSIVAGKQGVQDQPSALAQLREQIQNGDYSQIDKLVEQTVNERVGPLSAQVAQREAFDAARRMHPYVTEKEAEITQILADNPQVAQLAVANNYAALPTILYGIARDIEARELQSKLAASNASIETEVKKRVEAHLAKVRGLPATTSKVGNGSATQAREARTFAEAAEMAIQDYLAGGAH